MVPPPKGYKMHPAAKPTGITIAESTISWAFIWQTYAKCGKDWDTTIDAFWKARRCTGANGVQKYILCGFRHATKYILKASKEREDGKMENLRQWWLSLYERKRSTSQECADILDSLMEKFSIGEPNGNPPV